MTTIYLDESGYTGDDLINADQRYFVVASSIIGDDEAGSILRQSFPRYQGAEFKFTNIWKRGTHRNGLRDFARAIPSFQDRVFLWIIDKRFCLLTKMLDYLIEPPISAAGFDFYDGGYAQRYMNTAHRDILLHSEKLYQTSVTRWDAFARDPNTANMAALEAHLKQVAESTKPPLSSLYRFALQGLAFFKEANPSFEDFAGTSEIQLTSVFSSVIHWRQQIADDFALVHDESSNFLRQSALWSTMLRDDFVSPPLPQGNGTLVEFPLRVRSTIAVSSHDSPAVQLCDVLAGLGAKLVPTREGRLRDPFLTELIDLGASELTYAGVLPHRKYETGLPPRRTGPDMIDHMVELLRPEHDRRAAARDAAVSSGT